MIANGLMTICVGNLWGRFFPLGRFTKCERLLVESQVIQRWEVADQKGEKGEECSLKPQREKKNSFILESFWSSYLISSILKKVNFKPFSPNEGFQKRDIIKKVFHLKSFSWTRSDKHDSRSDQLGSFVLYTLCEWAKAMS